MCLSSALRERGVSLCYRLSRKSAGKRLFIFKKVMAEIFGAVARGAGLISLAIQLFESLRKLKDLYNASKDAPQTVVGLCFELETMSLSLRQLALNRRADSSGDELLGRCVDTCAHLTTRFASARQNLPPQLQKAFHNPGINGSKVSKTTTDLSLQPCDVLQDLLTDKTNGVRHHHYHHRLPCWIRSPTKELKKTSWRITGCQRHTNAHLTSLGNPPFQSMASIRSKAGCTCKDVVMMGRPTCWALTIGRSNCWEMRVT